MASEVEKAYLAGVMDGEGCIRIEKSGGKYRYLPHTPTVSVSNCNPALIRWILSTFGGHLYQKKNRGKYQTVWDVYWLGNKAIELLGEIYPYLVAKKEQADLVFSYRELVGKAGHKLSQDNVKKRLAIIEAMSILKHGNGTNRIG